MIPQEHKFNFNRNKQQLYKNQEKILKNYCYNLE